MITNNKKSVSMRNAKYLSSISFRFLRFLTSPFIYEAMRVFFFFSFEKASKYFRFVFINIGGIFFFSRFLGYPLFYRRSFFRDRRIVISLTFSPESTANIPFEFLWLEIFAERFLFFTRMDTIRCSTGKDSRCLWPAE